MAGSPASNLITAVEDSRRWRNVVRRPGDIVISAPPKSGVSWTQGIVASLLWPEGDAPGPRAELSPWVDSMVPSIDVLVERLEAQTHRRFLKTHSPGDCIPFDERCRYIVVYRNGRDALVSHEWQALGSPTRHLASWWPRRHASNVLFLHVDDMATDLEGEMRRTAAFLEIDIADDLWTQVVERCRVDAVRPAATTNRGYLASVAHELPADAAAWLEQGSLEFGHRPDRTGQPDNRVLDTGAWHPVFSRLGHQRPTNSIDAIAERRVTEARQAGLFDDLALHGKPIPDLAYQRPVGWWANQFVAKERNKVSALQLEQELRDAMPALWRLETASRVTTRVAELNGRIDRYNRATTLEPMDQLDIESVLATWRRLQGMP